MKYSVLVTYKGVLDLTVEASNIEEAVFKASEAFYRQDDDKELMEILCPVLIEE